MNTIPQETAGVEGMGSTSAMGSLGTRQAVLVVLVTATIAMPAASSSEESRLPAGAVVLNAQATTGGGTAPHRSAAVEHAERQDIARQALNELRRMSGLTWAQVARMFSVSRRSVHFWASGRPMSSEHEEHLHRLLGLVRGVDASAESVRAALLAVVDGDQVIEWLARREYARVAGALGAVSGVGMSRPSTPRTPLSTTASEGRRPLPVDVLANSEVHVSRPIEGRGRAARTRRSRGSDES